MMDCDSLKDFYEARALGILEGEERAELDAHLARRCPVCTPGVEQAYWLVSQLAYLAPPVAPPEKVRRELMAAVAPKPVPRAWFPGWLWAAATAALLLFSIFTLRQSRDLRDQTRDLAAQLKSLSSENQTYRRALAIAASAGSRSISLTSTQPQAPQLRAYWSDAEGLLLTARNMTPPAPDRTYQLWVVPKQGQPISAGIFRPDASGNVLLLPAISAKIAEAAALAITNEPPNGSPQPTSTPIWVGPLS